MQRRRMSDKQFQRLYQGRLPSLYRAALCLTGSKQAAEQAAAQAWLETAAEPAYAADEREFDIQSRRRLCQLCEKAGSGWGYDPWEILDVDYTLPTQAIAEGLAGLEYGDRVLIVFSVLLECGAAGTARVLRQPVWLVKRRLRRVCRALRLEALPGFENWRVCA